MKLVVDCETTGLNHNFHKLVTLALGNKDFGYHQFQFSCSPEFIDDEALRYNGITREDIESFPDRSSMILEFRGWLQKHTATYGKIEPIGHNYHFDCCFIEDLIGKDYYKDFFHHHYIDTMLAAQFINLRTKMFPSVSLKNLCKQLGIEAEQEDKALKDIKLTEQLLERLLEIEL